MRGYRLPALTVDRENWWEIVDTFRKETGVSDYPANKCLDQYGVCPVSVITPLSYALWQDYQYRQGLSRVTSFNDFLHLPQLYIDAVNVINHELERIKDGTE